MSAGEHPAEPNFFDCEEMAISIAATDAPAMLLASEHELEVYR